jgi:hypothetical protein
MISRAPVSNSLPMLEPVAASVAGESAVVLEDEPPDPLESPPELAELPPELLEPATLAVVVVVSPVVDVVPAPVVDVVVLAPLVVVVVGLIVVVVVVGGGGEAATSQVKPLGSEALAAKVILAFHHLSGVPAPPFAHMMPTFQVPG